MSLQSVLKHFRRWDREDQISVTSKSRTQWVLMSERVFMHANVCEWVCYQEWQKPEHHHIVPSELSLTLSLPYQPGNVKGKLIQFPTHSTASSSLFSPPTQLTEHHSNRDTFLVPQTLLLKHTSPNIRLSIPPPMQSGTVNVLHMCAPALLCRNDTTRRNLESKSTNQVHTDSYFQILQQSLFSSTRQPHLWSQQAFMHLC